VIAHQPERECAPGQHDRGEEDRVEHDEEDEQSARRVPRGQAGAAQRPKRQSRAAGASRRQQAGGRGPGQRDLRALPKPDPVRRAARDQRQQADVPEQGHDLEPSADGEPAPVGAESVLQRRGETVNRSTSQGDRGQRGCSEQRRERHPAGQGTSVYGGKGKLGNGVVGGKHGGSNQARAGGSP
jgi:hypothetical protein